MNELVEKVESYKSRSGRLFLSEESAVRHDVMEALCQVMPEFQMVRTRLEGNLDAVAQALAPMVDYRRRENHPTVAPETTAEDAPVAVRCRYSHPLGSRCPACQDVPRDLTVIPALEAGRA